MSDDGLDNDFFGENLAKDDQVVDNIETEPPKTAKAPPKRKTAAKSGKATGATTGAPAQLERVPMHVRQAIQAPSRPGYRRRVVFSSKDMAGRVARLQAAGYTIVDDGSSIGDPREGLAAGTGSASTRVVNPSNGGTGVLMEIPEEFYKQDMDAKHKKIDDDEESLISAGAEEVGGNVGEYTGKINL